VPAVGGKPVPVEPGPWGARVNRGDFEWSHDSMRLAALAVDASVKKQQILAVDARTGKSKAIWEEADPKWAQPASLGWSPDSRELFLLSDRDGFSHLYVVSAEGGAPRQITHGNWEIHPEMFSWEPQWIGEHLYYSSTEAGTAERQFYRVRPDGSGKQKLSSREGINLGLVSEDGRHTAWMRADEKNPLDLWVDGERVTRSVREDFSGYDWPGTRLVSFPSKGDGKAVAARLLLPPGYRPEDKSQKPRPAVVYIHGAGYATSVLKQWGSYNEMRYLFNCYLTHKGYVVLDLDYRGSSGYGREWRTDVYLHMGGKDLEDVLGGVEYLRSLGSIDMKRLGIWGISYGGFMTNMAMFQAADSFRAGASWAAVNDWENYNAGYTAQRLNTPQLNPEAYRRSSPITFASMLKNKLLIVHGMVDNNVLFQDAVQLTEKLIQERKDFAHIYYPEESHGFVREETLIDAYRRTAEWFDTWLQ
jgi:dipeptidyl aminopeptidase/acylaminoacyl peptidase